eukprot:SAG11_NODE_4722_length_1792_cov_12.591849_1_plen_97_part_00
MYRGAAVPKFGTSIILNLVSKSKSAAAIPGRFDSLVVDTTNGDDRYGHHLWPGLDQHIRFEADVRSLSGSLNQKGRVGSLASHLGSSPREVSQALT